jgi:hypothetical protein
LPRQLSGVHRSDMIENSSSKNRYLSGNSDAPRLYTGP